MVDDRNPLLLPDRELVRPKACCPKCRSAEYDGRNVGGTILFTCSNPSCRNQWAGGIGTPMDPRQPSPPTNPRDRPSVDFLPEYTAIDGRLQIKDIHELRRRIDTTPDYRRGLPIPSDEDNDV